MSRVVATASIQSPAAPERVLTFLRDYRDNRLRILTDNWTAYRVEQGGKGEGTVYAYHFTAGGRERDYRLHVHERAGRLEEQDQTSTFVSTWSAEPSPGGSTITIESSWEGATGIGWLLREAVRTARTEPDLRARARPAAVRAGVAPRLAPAVAPSAAAAPQPLGGASRLSRAPTHLLSAGPAKTPPAMTDPGPTPDPSARLLSRRGFLRTAGGGGRRTRPGGLWGEHRYALGHGRHQRQLRLRRAVSHRADVRSPDDRDRHPDHGPRRRAVRVHRRPRRLRAGGGR